MKIEVLGNCCATCHAEFEKIKKAAAEIDAAIEVEQVGDIMLILQYKVLQTPAVVIDGQVVSVGHHLSLQEAKDLIESHIK